MTKYKYIPCLLQLFRQYGYDATTLSKISHVTGLGKASLYYHFPGGKDEMMAEVLRYLEEWMGKHIVGTLQGSGDAMKKLEKMCELINQLYEGGHKPCVFAILLMGSARDIFQDKVKILLEVWIGEMTKVLIEYGLEQERARERAEDAVIAIQGSLVLAQGLDDVAPFQRVMAELPSRLCAKKDRWK